MQGCNQTASIKEVDSVFSKYIVSTFETRRHLPGVSAYSHSSGSKVRSRSVRGNETEEASGIFSALRRLGATFNHKDEGIQYVSEVIHAS